MEQKRWIFTQENLSLFINSKNKIHYNILCYTAIFSLIDISDYVILSQLYHSTHLLQCRLHAFLFIKSLLFFFSTT